MKNMPHVNVAKAKDQITAFRVRIAKAASATGQTIDKTFKVMDFGSYPKACLAALQFRDQNLKSV